MRFATHFLFGLIAQITLVAGASYEYCHSAIFFVMKSDFMSKCEKNRRTSEGTYFPRSEEVLSMFKINQKYYKLIYVVTVRLTCSLNRFARNLIFRDLRGVVLRARGNKLLTRFMFN